MSEKQIKKLGFILVKEYNHDQFTTRRYKKGVLCVEFTYEGKKKESVDFTIDEEVVGVEVNYTQILLLDKAFNSIGNSKKSLS